MPGESFLVADDVRALVVASTVEQGQRALGMVMWRYIGGANREGKGECQ